MKVVILAAGYGTRLQKDLEEEDKKGRYAFLKGIPKPLLLIAGIPLIDRWMHKLKKIVSLRNVVVVVNDYNKSLFEVWTKEWPEVTVVSDGSIDNDSRTGAVPCMLLGAKKAGMKDHTLFIAGDTLFPKDFSLSALVEHFYSLPSSSLIVWTKCSEEEVSKRGIIEVDPDGKVTSFLEKPKPDETTSRKQCPSFYLIHKTHLPLLDQFLKNKADAPLKAKDATGLFIEALISVREVHAMQVSGRYDLGGLVSYLECDEDFKEQDQNKML